MWTGWGYAPLTKRWAAGVCYWKTGRADALLEPRDLTPHLLHEGCTASPPAEDSRSSSRGPGTLLEFVPVPCLVRTPKVPHPSSSTACSSLRSPSPQLVPQTICRYPTTATACLPTPGAPEPPGCQARQQKCGTPPPNTSFYP